MITKEIHKGNTPNGGVSSEIYYLDEKLNASPKDKASMVRVRELDEKGNLVFETLARINQ